MADRALESSPDTSVGLSCSIPGASMAEVPSESVYDAVTLIFPAGEGVGPDLDGTNSFQISISPARLISPNTAAVATIALPPDSISQRDLNTSVSTPSAIA